LHGFPVKPTGQTSFVNLGSNCSFKKKLQPSL
jgi:hypothetical protein